MGEPRVSVLVTFYNQEKYVNQTLQSIINQKTDFQIKILVGDDGSSDKTCKIVRKWMDEYPNVFELYVMDRTPGKYISGFRASRNRINLLKYVNTEYFIYLDGDDFFDYECKLQKQVEILDDKENQDCIACGHNMDMLYLDGKRVPLATTKITEGKYGPKEYWSKMYCSTDTLLIRSSVIPELPIQLLENNFNDNLITFSIIQKGNLYYIPESWAVYLQTGDGIWTSGKTVENYIRNMFIYDLCNQINPDMKKETIHRYYRTWLSLLKIRKQINAAELEAFSAEAKDKHMENSYNWVHYQELSLPAKQKLCMEAVIKLMDQTAKKVLNKAFHFI